MNDLTKAKGKILSDDVELKIIALLANIAIRQILDKNSDFDIEGFSKS